MCTRVLVAVIKHLQRFTMDSTDSNNSGNIVDSLRIISYIVVVLTIVGYL